MLTLYVKTGCAYCAKVLRTGEELGIDFALKNVADPGVADELIEKGGKRQEPYLIDDARGVAMYEADDIVRYLREHYAPHADTV
jgi:glutaredoxin